MRNWLGINLGLLLLLLSCDASEKPINEEQSENALNAVNVENAWWISSSEIQGTTQGTTFVVKTSEDSLFTTPEEISRFLAEFDQELSGYIDTSLLSQLNSAVDTFVMPSEKFFTKCYDLSQAVFTATNGAFDPSVFPLVKQWGFFKDITQPPSKEAIDSILAFVGFEKGKLHDFSNATFIKKDPRFMLDFNAIAQGQSVDELAELLDKKGQKNYFIEVGGELKVKGVNPDGKPWIIGIDLPSEENDGKSARNLENYLSLSSGAIATSGNYRKFYEKDGKKYSHTLDPSTGFPVEHQLLSATVYAESAAIADAYATAFMVMGVEKTMNFVRANPQLQIHVYLLFENQNGRIERAYSEGMQQFLL